MPVLAPFALPVQRPVPGDGWMLEHAAPGAPLLVALGGMPAPGEPPGFEFQGLRARLRATGLFLRDLEESWYLRGVRDAADDLPGLAAWLREQVQRLQPSRTVLVGNSAGAYAALALGALVDADEVIAIVPRSALSDEVNDALGDDRLRERRAGVQHLGPLDLVPLLEGEAARRWAEQGGRPAYRTRFRVLHALDNAQDRAHAARLTGLPETVVQAYPRGDHRLAAVLRAGGELDPLVAAALAGPRRRTGG